MNQTDPRAAAVREFNRFYTRRIGALGEGHLGTGFSLSEARVLYELTQHATITASEIADTLDIDPGYLSRTLRKFKSRGFISSKPGSTDRRQTVLSITAAGKRAYLPLEKATLTAVAGMLEPLSQSSRRDVLKAMTTIRQSLDPDRAPRDNAAPPYVLRDPKPGDLGWIVHRHGVLYSSEYGYDQRFEAIVARIVADFVDNFDAPREKCWVADRDGEILGCIFIVAKSKTVAKLRLLLVEPTARGMGLGRRLVDEVIQFAKSAGYKKIELWTQTELAAARRIYAATGFVKVAEKQHEMFGGPTTAETWELKLTAR